MCFLSLWSACSLVETILALCAKVLNILLFAVLPCNFIVKYHPLWRCLPLSTPLHHTPPHITLIPKHPKLPYNPISVVPSLVSTNIYLCSLTFSLRPDEVASVLRQQKPVFKNVIYCFVSAPWRYYVMDTNKVSNLFSYYLMDLKYSDDNTMLSNTITDLKAGLNVFQEEASKLGLQVSLEKTKLMYVSDGPDPPPITAETITAELMNSFNYLGSTVMNIGNLNEEINGARVLP